MQTHLIQLHHAIDQRVAQIRDAHSDWLCGKGCAKCCRSLAEIPTLTQAEWDLLRDGLAALPAEDLQAVAERMVAMAQQTARPFTCPMLDQTNNACPVYLQRPVACRSYGFYVQRDLGLYCGDIEQQVAAGELADVVWGNHDAVDHTLASLGPTRPLSDWFADWQKHGHLSD